jgi:DNA-binding CsgD family transcriptional regulator
MSLALHMAPGPGRADGPDQLRPPAELVAARLETPGLEVAVLEWRCPPGRELGPPLTPAEIEVVRLVLAGHSNQAIAALRRRSSRTVAKQLASAYSKVGVGSRSELAAWVARRGIGP